MIVRISIPINRKEGEIIQNQTNCLSCEIVALGTMTGPHLTTVTQTKNVDSVENSLAVPEKVKHRITL